MINKYFHSQMDYYFQYHSLILFLNLIIQYPFRLQYIHKFKTIIFLTNIIDYNIQLYDDSYCS